MARVRYRIQVMMNPVLGITGPEWWRRLLAPFHRWCCK